MCLYDVPNKNSWNNPRIFFIFLRMSVPISTCISLLNKTIDNIYNIRKNAIFKKNFVDKFCIGIALSSCVLSFVYNTHVLMFLYRLEKLLYLSAKRNKKKKKITKITNTTSLRWGRTLCDSVFVFVLFIKNIRNIILLDRLFPNVLNKSFVSFDVCTSI